MTFKEKLKHDYPLRVSNEHAGGCISCPTSYGYEARRPHFCLGHAHDVECTACWNREMPGTEPTKPEVNNIPVDMAALGAFIKEIAKDPSLYISIGIGHGTLNIGITHTSEED